MRRLSGYSLLCLLALILTGCFQTAGNAVEPTIALATATPPFNPTLPPTLVPAIPTEAAVSTSDTINGGASMTMAATAAPVVPSVVPTDAPTAQSIPTTAGPSVAPSVPGSISPTVNAPSNTPNAALPNGSPTSALLPATALVAGTDSVTPTNSVLNTPTPFASESPCTHTVQPNEHLYSIARQYKVSYDDLLRANPNFAGRPDQLQPGDVLQIPNCGQPTSVPQAAVPVQPQPSALVQPTLTGGAQPYTVAAGDSLTVIAHKFGVTVAQIKTANGLTSDFLSIGQKLIIPPPSS